MPHPTNIGSRAVVGRVNERRVKKGAKKTRGEDGILAMWGGRR